jgi:hypothetical protein
MCSVEIVAMADGLLPAGVGADALDGQIDLDEALGVGGHYGLVYASSISYLLSILVEV